MPPIEILNVNQVFNYHYGHNSGPLPPNYLMNVNQVPNFDFRTRNYDRALLRQLSVALRILFFVAKKTRKIVKCFAT